MAEELSKTVKGSFEDRFFQETDKETDKKKKFAMASAEKQLQLTKQLGDNRMAVARLEEELENSYINAKANSVEIHLSLMVAREELEVTQMIMDKLFPRNAS